MITDPDRLKHDRSPYERPNVRFRCGREALWGTPCRRGPTPDGSCGGVTECTPAKNKSGRFECRRPANAGGACPEGPLPDGSCSHTHPPCHPMVTLRVQRGRLAVVAFSLVLALVGVLLSLNRRQRLVTLSPINPGALTRVHANAIVGQGCVACHAAHDRDASTWLRAVVTTSAPANQCLSCHAFGGPAFKAHNAIFSERPDLKDTTCVMCHSEHRGAQAHLTNLTDAQCSTCHTVKIGSFSKDHPKFPERFPYEDPTAIAFDHTAHLNRYFKDQKFAARAPQSCLACHALEPGRQRRVTTRGFEQSCATCHAAEIGHQDLVLFRFPALTSPIDPAIVQAACGTATTEHGNPQTTQPVSEEKPTVINGFLLGIDTNDPDAYSEPIKTLLAAMAKEGTVPLAEALDGRAGSQVSTELLAGLSPEIVRRAACAWAANQEYQPMENVQRSGWYADELSLRYTPRSHADPIAKRWLEFSLNAPTRLPAGTAAAADAHTHQHAQTLRKSVLARARGVGLCLKCHVVSAETTAASEQVLAAHWISSGGHERGHTQFSHGVHVKLLGGTSSCTACHTMRQETTHGTESVESFQPITKERCAACHGARQVQEPLSYVRQDCLLCHTYHLESGTTRANTSLTRTGQPGIEEREALLKTRAHSQQIEASLVTSSEPSE